MRTILLTLIIATVLSGCKNKTENTDFETSVLIEIIPTIVDSTCHDPRIFLSPLPYALFPPKGTEISETEKVRLIKLRKLKLDSIRKDTASIYLAFNPLIKPSSDSLEKKIAKYTGKNILPFNTTEKLVLDINSIQLNNHFKFKHDSLFSEKFNIWNKKYEFIFSGFFGVSRILFDESKKYGILSAGYTCGDRCGQGYIIYIKKHGNKWMIDKIENTWIS